MKQVAYFTLPEELDKANEFLAKHPPENVSMNAGTFFKKGSIVVNYDDQSYPDSYVAEELRALIVGNKKNTLTTNISLAVLRNDLDKKEKELTELLSTEVIAVGKEKYDLNVDRDAKIKAYEDTIKNIKSTINGMEQSISTSDTKIAVLTRELSKLNLG